MSTWTKGTRHTATWTKGTPSYTQSFLLQENSISKILTESGFRIILEQSVLGPPTFIHISKS